jgi:hypothetical protein
MIHFCILLLHQVFFLRCSRSRLVPTAGMFFSISLSVIAASVSNFSKCYISFDGLPVCAIGTIEGSCLLPVPCLNA